MAIVFTSAPLSSSIHQLQLSALSYETGIFASRSGASFAVRNVSQGQSGLATRNPLAGLNPEHLFVDSVYWLEEAFSPVVQAQECGNPMD